MADAFRVALSGDFRKQDGSPTYIDFDLAPLREAPGVEMQFFESQNPLRAGAAEGFRRPHLPCPPLHERQCPERADASQ